MALQKVVTGVIGNNAVGITQLNVSDGSNGQALVTNGSGTLSFASVGVTGISSSADATAITIDSSERVGIGKTPSTWHLDVDSSGTNVASFDGSNNTGVVINSSSSIADIIGYSNSASSYNALNIRGASGTGLVVDTSNNVGIGTSSPTTHLSVTNSGFSNTSTTGIPAIRTEGAYGGGIGLVDTKEAGWYAQDSGDTLYQYVGRASGTGASSSIVMTYKSSGNVGIGTTSPANYSNYTTLNLGQGGTGSILQLDGSTSGHYHLVQNNNGDMLISADQGNAVGSTHIKFLTDGSERWRINSAGQMTNGFAATGSILQVAGNSVGGGVVGIIDPDVSVSTGNVILQLTFSVDQDATNGKFAQFSDNNHNCGSISAASGTSVSFNTSSDERLKKNIVDASSQLSVIKNIKVREFDWKQNNHHEVGMIAQELNTVIPNVVSEGSDEDDMYWGIDYGKLTPYLIKAVQELSAKNDALEARIATLEG